MKLMPLESSVAQSEPFRSAAATHAGARREENQDAFLNRPDLGVWAVADGAGGHSCGALAAQAVIAALDGIPLGLTAAELLVQLRLRLDGAHAGLLRETETLGENAVMASTVVVLIARGEHFACLWAGDSRAYRLRDGVLEQLTHDHSVVQELLDAGAIDAASAGNHPEANLITRAVGDGCAELRLEKIVGSVVEGNRFLLCSDGISKTLGAGVLAELIAGSWDEGRDTGLADRLLDAALARGASDNITAVVVDVGRAGRGQ
jgi:serine/threonine protein phosphatase Stp1